MKIGQIFKNGIMSENPTFRLVLGTCPTLAVTTAAINGIGMGAAATFVLVGSNVMVALLRNFIPKKVRIPAYVVIIAAFVTIVQLVMQGFAPDLYQSLGIFIPLIVVNCIILGRAEAFASKNSVGASALDGLAMGIGFTLSITLIAAIREILGAGTIFGVSILGEAYTPALIMILAPGGFLTYGLLMALFNWIGLKRAKNGGKA